MGAEPLRVMVLGAAGRMGRMVTAAVVAADGLVAVAGVDLAQVDGSDLPVYESVEAAVEATSPAVAIDFTVHAAARENLPRVIALGVSPVIGTTGLDDAWPALDALAKQHGVPGFVAPNFALGAVLMMRFAAEAAKWFDFADIIEYHHENKIDAPSGTALKTLRGMLSARGHAFSDTPPETERIELEGARGGSEGFAHVHSVRMPGVVADQDVLLGGQGETLRISHRSLDRSCFMPGVVLAAKKVRGLPPGLTIGLDGLLFGE